ncbi:motility-associated ABC transporter substrate-binding family protein [Zavarzinella formosa]|uniref:hypothetical protein n=1 Tax=Zavarzinella formosa TaxID=360055 RepID=UPI00030B57A7|nr:hypothetical protein [Zavarzinella formosa]
MTTEQTPSDPFPFLVTSRKPTAVFLGVLAVLFAITAIWWGMRASSAQRSKADADPAKNAAKAKQLPDEFKLPEEKKDDQAEGAGKAPSKDYGPAAFWAGFMALLCGGGAFWLSRPAVEGEDVVSSRTEMLVFGAVAGLLTALLGFTLAFRWSESLALWLNKEEQGEAKWVLISQGIFFIGLTLMFVSTQLGRAEQRNNVLLRRLMHGFNAAFQGILIVYVLVALNIVVFFNVPGTLITNDSAFTTLADESKKLLRSLDQPVHAYLIMPEKFAPTGKAKNNNETLYTHLYTDSRGLLGQAEDQSKFFKATFLSPLLDKDKITALYDRLGMKGGDGDRYGILLVVGDGDKPVTGFLEARDLLEIVPTDDNRPQVIYQGESKLMSELAYLTDNKAKLAVYFTSGHGELSFDPSARQDRSMSGVINFLRDRRLRPEILKLDPAAPKIPDDAALVVIAGPQMTIPADDPLLTALAEYMNPKTPDVSPGKLLAFLPPFRGVTGKIAPTGLEGLLAGLGVESGEGVMVTIPRTVGSVQGRVIPPDYLPGLPADVDHPLINTFSKALILNDCRPIRPAARPNPAMRVTALVETQEGRAVWIEEKEAGDAVLSWEAIRRNPAGPEAAARKLTNVPQPLILSVGAVSPPTSPGEQPKEKPRAVIFTTDSLLLDRPAFPLMPPAIHQQIVSDSVDWLREREQSIGIRPRLVPWYRLPKPIEVSSKLTLLAMVTLGLTAMGVMVWYSRRR